MRRTLLFFAAISLGVLAGCGSGGSGGARGDAGHRLGSKPAVCPDIACYDSAHFGFVRDEPWEPGSYRLDLVMDGEASSCTIGIPEVIDPPAGWEPDDLTPVTILSIGDCDGPLAISILETCYASGCAQGILGEKIGVSIMGVLPTAIEYRLAGENLVPAEGRIDFDYQPDACQPDCMQAHAEIPIR